MHQHDDEPRQTGGYVPFMPGPLGSKPNRAQRREAARTRARARRRTYRATVRALKAAAVEPETALDDEEWSLATDGEHVVIDLETGDVRPR